MQSDAAMLSNPSIYFVRLHVLLMKKTLELFEKGVLLQLFIVFLIVLSTSMLMNGTKMSVQTLCDVILLLLKYNHFLSIMLSILLLQLLKSIPGLETHRGSASEEVFVHFVGGGLAGITAASATYPLDLVRTRLAAQVKYNICGKVIVYSSG